MRDREAKANELVSIGLDGDFHGAGLSGDGRYILFWELNAGGGLYLRDRAAGTTTLLESTGKWGAMSKNARYVAFSSEANDLVPGDTNGQPDVFLRDRQANSLERVSVATAGTQANAGSNPNGVSADGRFVLFTSRASNLTANDTNNASDVFVRDRLNRTTTRVSARSDGTGGNGSSSVSNISADGRYVAFVSLSSDLVPGDTNASEDVFVRDLTTGQVERVSLTSKGGQFSGTWYMSPGISDDGRFVSFNAFAAYVRDRLLQTTSLVSVASDGTRANGYSYLARLSGDGRWVTFVTRATNLDPRDTSGSDVYLHERGVDVSETLVVEPAALKFGEVAVGSASATMVITVANTGAVALSLPWVNLRGYDAADFRMVRRCPNPLPAGARCTIDVRFVPATSGAKQARIVVSTGPDGIRKKVALRGTGL